MGPVHDPLAAAFELYQRQAYAAAREEVLRVLEEEPERSRAHALLGLCQIQLGELDEAERAARRAIELAPEEAGGFEVLTRVLCVRGRLVEAAHAANEALALEQDEPVLYYLRGIIAHDAQDFEGAMQMADQGLALDPGHIECLQLRVLVLIATRRQEEAGAALDQLFSRDPDGADTHSLRGWWHLLRHRPGQALPYFREALRLDPGDAIAREGLLASMKGRIPLLGWLLQLVIALSRIPYAARRLILLVVFLIGWFFYRSRAEDPSSVPFFEPYLLVHAVYILLFAQLDMLLNLVLLLSRDGRRSLAPAERRGALLVGALISGGGACFAWGLDSGAPGWTLGAVALAGSSISVTAAVQLRDSPSAPKFVAGAALLCGAAVAGVLILMAGARSTHAAPFLVGSLIGAVVAMLAAKGERERPTPR